MSIPKDLEISAMKRVTDIISKLDERAQKRVIGWLYDRTLVKKRDGDMPEDVRVRRE